MTDICIPCREAGFPNVVAHYKGVKPGQSQDGKGSPAMCFDHKHGKIPKFIQNKTVSVDKINKEEPFGDLIKQVHKEVEEQKIQIRSDNNDYTPLTEEQIKKAKQLNKDGLTNKEIGDKLGVKPWRIQRITGTPVDKIKDTYTPEEKNKHIRADTIVKAPEMSRIEYERKYGIIGKRKLSQSTLDLWDRIVKLSVDNVLILPMKDNESTNSARGRYTNILARCKREFKPRFSIRLVGVQEHRHVVLFKTNLDIRR